MNVSFYKGLVVYMYMTNKLNSDFIITTVNIYSIFY